MKSDVYKSIFSIPKMDCPCEENLIRMKLQEVGGILRLDFDLAERKLTVLHTGDPGSVEAALKTLGLGATLIVTEQTEYRSQPDESSSQRKVLIAVLLINFAFFLLEIATGIISGSMGLVADSLDMLADALVYGMSLMVVGAVLSRKKKVARYCGYIQIVLALGGITEVIRRFISAETPPAFQTMIGISLLALIANAFCLWLLQRTKSKEAHIRASVIFSANDVIINAGVIAAGLLVWWLDSGIPDLVVGIIVFIIVLRGAVRILKLAK